LGGKNSKLKTGSPRSRAKRKMSLIFTARL
jgi:hypothetical protein